MSDISANTPKSKRRRNRRKNRKHTTQNGSDSDIVDVDSETTVEEEEYIVNSPEELGKNPRETKKPIKSRSLDDDEMLNIQELSEVSETDDKDKENQAIISEASESEVEWEETTTLPIPSPSQGTLSSLTLPLDSYSTVQVTLISPEEEKTLRNFLERLNLVNGPEEAAKLIDDLNTIESIKQRKARKRAELEQYFLPFVNHPRLLDVISEEDTDREQASLTRNLKQVTPDLDIPPKVPPRPKRQIRRTLPKAFASPIEQAPPILVGAKILDSTRVSEGFCSTMQAEEPTSDVEVVYLDDSSGSNSPAEPDDTNNIESHEKITRNEAPNGNIETDKGMFTQKTGNFKEETSTVETLPGGQETITTSSSTKCNFVVKTDKANDDIVDDGIISQLTPPPTPDSISPMNEKNLPTNNEKQTQILPDSNTDKLEPDKTIKTIPPTVVNTPDVTYKPFTESQASIVHANVLTPPPPPIRSSSSSTSSSRGSSLCTAKYIPTTSSLTDMTVLTEETDYRPPALREICLKFLVTLPFGQEILQELAETSKTLDSYTKSFPQPLSPKIVPNLAQFVSSTKKETNHVPSDLSVKKTPKKQPAERNIPITKEWLESTEKKFETWKQLRGLTEPNPREWVQSLSEIDILREEQNLEKTDNILREVNIPIKKKWVSQQHLDKQEIIIPIHKDWEDHGNKHKEERRASFPTVDQWNELRTLLDRREALGALSCLRNDRFIPITKEWTETLKKEDKLTTPLYKEWVQSPNKSETIAKETNIPITIDRNTEENAQEVVNIPIQQDTSEVTKPVYKEWAEFNSDMASKSKEVTIPLTKEWVGMPTEADPNVLLCLSPKQKEELEKTKKVPNEAEKLLDLHNKFINRTSHEEIKKTQEEKVTITNVTKTSSSTVPISITNRLLAIIREEPNVITSNEDSNYLYFVEKDPKHKSTLTKNVNDARLKAKDLTEWLNLARSKSMSESNLSNIPAIPENNLRDVFTTPPPPRRRTSLPYDLYERQLFYLQEKEREIQKQLQDLEQERRKINSDMAEAENKEFHLEDYKFSRKGDYAETRKRPISMPLMPTEFFRQQMYQEYLDQCAAREQRQQHKVIKVSSSRDLNQACEKEIIHPIEIEKEFMDKVKQKQKEGILESSKSLDKDSSVDKEMEEGEPVLVMNGDELKEAKKLPKHLQEFVQITKQLNEDGIWSPGQRHETRQSPTKQKEPGPGGQQDDSIIPVWTPKSANSSPTPTAERKEFKSVNFQSPVLNRKTRTKSENLGSESPLSGPRWKFPDYSSDTGIASSAFEKRLTSSQSSPASGFGDISPSPRLPRAQNPTITLLQKAREGHLPRGAAYIDQEPQKQFRPKNDRPPIANPGEILYQIKHEYTSETESDRPRRMAELGPRKFQGIGPVTKDGMPLILRSEVKDQNQSKWYKRMYDTIHKQKPHSDEYVTVRYKQKRAQYPYSSGYLSEPEPGAYDSDFTEYKYQTLDRRRPPMLDTPTNYTSSTMPRNIANRSSSTDILRTLPNPYKKHPGRIENYTPGHSSISEKEAREWWDEVMDIFDGHLEQQKRYPQRPKSFINQALKESGYESDSTLVFRRREEAASQQLSPKEQREVYKAIQKGGDVPLHGLRKLAPERPKDPEPPLPPPKGQHARNYETESPRKYVENEVTIHYKTPVRQEIKDYISEDELAYRQSENMKKIYQEERRKKYLQVSKSLQELQDINARRHTDNFIPSQKSPISLNRYDDFDSLAPAVKPRPKSPEPRLVARALYNFVGQTARELTFRKGDLIYVRRQVDKNWYEGELNAMVGLFPTNYVEIVPYEGVKTTPRKSHEGQARAKYNFLAQTHLELSLAKGELVVITRKVDDNWFEGKIGGRKGIFPASYVDVLIDPQEPPPTNAKPVASPAAHSLLLNGSAGGKESMGAHCYTPSSGYPAKSGSFGRKRPSVDEALHIETQSEPIAYRALYKYAPQNDDELELLEGDTVYVLEKCDDGWYVGSSNRTGAFGTFPGNYVEKI